MGVLLAHTDENDGFARGIDHVESGTDLVIDCVELGHDNGIDDPWVVVLDSKIDQRLVEFGQLVDGIISNQGLSNEENGIRLVDVDQLGQGLHEGLVALHTAGCIDQDDVVVLVLGLSKCLFGDDGRVIFVAFLVKRNLEARSMSLKLLDGSGSEVIAASNQDAEVSFGLEVIGDLREGSGLADAIDPNEDNAVDLALLLSTNRLLKDIDVLLRSQELGNGFDECLLYCGLHRSETCSLLLDQAFFHRFRDSLSDFC